MTKEREALKLALALALKGKAYAEECSHMATQADIDEFDTVATAIKEVLAQLEQEPVAIVDGDAHSIHVRLLPEGMELKPDTKLYTTPPQRTWVWLTDEDKAELDEKYGDDTLAHLDAIEAKLKEKNTK